MPAVGVAGFLANMLVILASARLFGRLAERLGQPKVLGELVAGVVLGCGFLTFFHPDDRALGWMAEAGVLLLLFETGLDSDLGSLLQAGPASLAVAAVGVAVPFLLGAALMTALGHGGMGAVFAGAALTATSVGITARVLTDLGKLAETESQIILGAAVVDDVIGVAILAVLQQVGASGAFSWRATAEAGGLAAAFAAGLLLARTRHKDRIRASLKPISTVLVPVFFVMVGSRVQLGMYNPFVPGGYGVIGLALMLIFCAVAGKLASGWAVWTRGLNSWAIGVGMIPRGEVGLVFAQVGLSSGAIGPELYAAVVGMVVATTFLAPPLLKRAFR